MSDQIEKYLRKMCKQIKSKSVRESAYIEIKNHILDSSEELMKKGLLEEDAIREFLKNTTHPRSLGKRLNIARRPFILRYPLVLLSSSFLFILAIGLIVGSNYVVSKYLSPKRLSHFKHVENFEEKFKKDLDVLAEYETSNERKRNAHFYLSKKLSAIEVEEKEIINDIYTKWKNDEPIASSNLVPNTEWVIEALNFDHWNFYKDEEIKKNFKFVSNMGSLTKLGAISSYQIPDFILFKNISILQSISLIKTGHTLKAEKLFNQAVKLLKTTNTLVGYSLASSMLKRKNRIIKKYDLNWSLVDLHYAEAVKRVPFGWASMFHRLNYSMGSLENWKKYMKPKLGMCVGAAESPLGLTVLADFLSDKVLFESDHKEDIQESRLFMRKILKDCDLKEIAYLLDEPKQSPGFMDADYNLLFVGIPKPLGSLSLNIAAIPYLRRIAAAYVANRAFPVYERVYLQH